MTTIMVPHAHPKERGSEGARERERDRTKSKTDAWQRIGQYTGELDVGLLEQPTMLSPGTFHGATATASTERLRPQTHPQSDKCPQCPLGEDATTAWLHIAVAWLEEGAEERAVIGKDIAIRSSISAGSACKMLPILALVPLNIGVILAFYAGFRLMALASLRHNEDPVTTKLATLVRTGGGGRAAGVGVGVGS